jgi:hypothetical protein
MNQVSFLVARYFKFFIAFLPYVLQIQNLEDSPEWRGLNSLDKKIPQQGEKFWP